MKISVIMPCYNQGHFLEETCNSISNQTYQNWEVLIINDGSTDNTEKIALNICDKDNRFRYLYQDNGGLSSARNLGLKNAIGDYIQFLDSDDILLADKFLLSIKEKSDLIITNFEMLLKNKVKPPFCDLNNREFTYENLLLQWDIDFSIPIHCGLFSSKIAKQLTFNEDLKAKEDWCFWLDFLKKSSSVKYINKSLLYYRIHDNNMTRDNTHMLKYKKEVYLFLFDNLSDAHRSQFFKRLNKEYTKEQEKTNFILKRERKRRKKLLIVSVLLTLLSSILLINSI